MAHYYIKFIKYISLLILTFLIWSCNLIQDHKTLYIAHNLNQSHPVHRGIVAFQHSLDSLSLGKLKLKIFPDGQLGSEREMLELLQIGSIAMTKVSAATMANFAPQYKVLGVPYLFNNREHMFNVLNSDIGTELKESSSKFLLKGLCFYYAGSRSFYTTNTPIHTPADLSGLRIRVMNHQMSVEMVNAMGGAATPMSYGELYTALQQGVVDGAENNPPSFVSSNHYEVAKNFTIDEHSSIPDVVVISTKFWDTLNKEEQDWLIKASEISVLAQLKFWDQSVKESMEVLENANVNIIRPNKELFSNATSSVIDKLNEDPAMKRLIEKIKLFK